MHGRAEECGLLACLAHSSFFSPACLCSICAWFRSTSVFASSAITLWTLGGESVPKASPITFGYDATGLLSFQLFNVSAVTNTATYASDYLTWVRRSCLPRCLVWTLVCAYDGAMLIVCVCVLCVCARCEVHYCVTLQSAARHDGASVMYVYRNAGTSSVLTNTATPMTYSTSTAEYDRLYVGSQGPTAAAGAWQGELDELRVFQRLLALVDISTSVGAGSIWPTNGLALYLSFQAGEADNDATVFDWSGADRHAVNFVTGIVTRNRNPNDFKCILRQEPRLRKLQLLGGDNAPIQITPAFDTNVRNYTATVALAGQRTVASVSIPSLATRCSLSPRDWLPATGRPQTELAGETACVDIPVGGSCTFTPTGTDNYFLTGPRLQCQPNGEFTGFQAATSPLPTLTGAGSLPAAVKQGSMAHCASNGYFFFGGGQNAGVWSTSLYRAAAVDSGIPWQLVTSSLARYGSPFALVCTADGRLHQIGPTDTRTDSVWLDQTTGAELGTYTINGLVASGYPSAVAIPSSNYLDIVMITGEGNAAVYRFSGGDNTWAVAAHSWAVPWQPRSLPALVYANPTTLLLIGGIDGAWNTIFNGRTREHQNITSALR